MRTFIALLLAIASVTTSLGQGDGAFAYVQRPVSAAQPSPVFIQQASPMKLTAHTRAQREITAGMILVGVGAVLQVTGAIVHKTGSDEADREKAIEDRENYDAGIFQSAGQRKQFKGGVMFVAGTALAIPGTVLWIKGVRAHQRDKRTQSLHLNLGAAPSLCYRF